MDMFRLIYIIQRIYLLPKKVYVVKKYFKQTLLDTVRLQPSRWFDLEIGFRL